MSRISVITINYNNAAGLEATVRSVAEQIVAPFEFIVIDGGSTDGSVEVMKRHAGTITHSVSEKDGGIYNAQNKGLLKATGDYCLFLNSGDTLASNDVLEIFAEQGDKADIIYGDLYTVDKSGRKELLSSPGALDVYHFMISTLWHPCAFIRRGLFMEQGLYNEQLRIAGDYEFFIRSIIRYGASTRHVAVPVAVFDLGGISSSPEHTALQQKERRMAWELNFSSVVIDAFETKTRIQRSREYKLGKLFVKLFGSFVK